MRTLVKFLISNCQLSRFSLHWRTARNSLCIATLALMLMSSVAYARPHSAFDSSNELDRQIATTLQSLATGNLAEARLFARQLAWRFPDFALGQLISAELESTAAFRDVTISGDGKLNKRLVDLLLEAQARLNAPRVPDSELLPAALIQLGSDVSDVLMVDLSQSTLFQFAAHQSKPTLIRQHYIGSGKAGFGKRVEGDNKTPLGVYRITGLRSDASLPDLYGSGALMLNYPNALDRHFGRTGSGIWLHGVPHSQRSRAPRSSEGCVTMSNDHFSRLQDHVSVTDSRVILTNHISWISATEHAEKRALFRSLFKRYQEAWTTSDQTQLLALYENNALLGKRLKLSPSDLSKVSSSALASTPTPHLQSAYLNALAAVNPDEVTIIRSPALRNSTAAPHTNHAIKYMVMSMQLGHLNEQQLTVYWAQGLDRHWRVVTEQLDGKSI